MSKNSVPIAATRSTALDSDHEIPDARASGRNFRPSLRDFETIEGDGDPDSDDNGVCFFDYVHYDVNTTPLTDLCYEYSH